MAITTPKGEQIQFVSSKSGAHILDTYLEAAEVGNRPIYDLLQDLFSSSDGKLKTDLFEWHYRGALHNHTIKSLAYRTGTYTNAQIDEGWQVVTPFFNARGLFDATKVYHNFDLVTVTNKDVYIHTGSAAPFGGGQYANEAAFINSASNVKLINMQHAAEWAVNQVNLVDNHDYSAKAYAIGGGGVTNTALDGNGRGGGAAKEWATKTSGTVDGTGYSAKYWATQSNVGTVAGISSNITTVAGISSAVSTVAADPFKSNISTVAGISANVSTVAGISANTTTVAGISAAVSTVATRLNTLGAAGTRLTVNAAGNATVWETPSPIRNAAQILTEIKTVDGATSGLDADLLDGQHGSYYTAYADTAVSNLVDSSPAALNTLNELAAAMGDDAAFSTTVTNSIATKLPLAGGNLTGDLTLLQDNRQIIIGADSDGKFKIDGSNNLSLENSTIGGVLSVSASELTLKALNSSGVKKVGFSVSPHSAILRHPGQIGSDGYKITTSTSGVTVSGSIAISGTVDGRDIATDGTKLDGIEASATADQTAAEIKTLVGNASDSNVLTDASLAKINAALPTANFTSTANTWAGVLATSLIPVVPSGETISVHDLGSASHKWRDLYLSGGTINIGSQTIKATSSGVQLPELSIGTGTNKVKLSVGSDGSMSTVSTDSSGNTSSAVKSLTASSHSEIRAAVEAASDSNVFADADHSKLGNIEAGATTDQTNAEIRAAVEAASDSNVFTNADHTKLGNIEASADVTDTANVVSALSAGSGIAISGAGAVSSTLAVGDGGLTQVNFTSGDNTKLDGIAASANNYVHPTTNGNNHIPSDGASGQILRYGSAGTAVWGADTDTDTVYTHPNHSGEVVSSADGATVIVDNTVDEANLKVSNNPVNGYILTAQSGNTGGLTWQAANNYSHPSGAGNNHIPTGGSSNQFLKYSASGVAVWAADNNTTYSVGDGGLTTNNFTDADHTKLNAVAASATANPNALDNLSEDTSPQLGGNLDVQAREIITSTSNGNVKITPNGSGVVEVKGAGGNDGTLQLNCSANTHGVKIKSPPHSASASYTLTLPNTDGSANQVLKTDGSGNLDWVAQTTDTNTTYSVGDGQLSQINFTSADHSKLDGITASANNYTHPNHSGEVTSSADGATVIAGNVVDEANLKVSNGPVDGYMLTAQSGATGGLTWAAQPSTSLPSLAGAGKVLTINSGNSAATWATPSGGGVSEDTVIALAIALG